LRETLQDMTDLDQESLFSLELIVDRLCLHQSVECRIPAVAFRLLDFPTLLIYHVEPELAAAIRLKLLSNRCQSVPAQLSELKDRKTGAFLISRGKSCLFRVSPNAALSGLSSAPLYVMVVDMFPETPKLVGSCGIPLSHCVRDLYNDIVTNGISVPAVRAEKKELHLCNLMGAKLGTVLLGCRLLSLGASLLSHIPTHHIVHVKPAEEVDHSFNSTADKVPQSIAEAHVAAKQAANASRSSDSTKVDKITKKSFADSQTQVELPSFGSVGTQTSRLRSHTGKPRTTLANDADDIIMTNVICPPPLYYNSATCRKTVCWHHEEWSAVWQRASDDSNWSDDGTIRLEDKYLDDDEEAKHNVNFSHSRVNDKPSSHAQSRNRVRNDPVSKTPDRPRSMTEFPILGALMAEILQFRGMNFVPDTTADDAHHEVRYKIEKMKKGPALNKEDPAKAVEPRRSVCQCANTARGDSELVVAKQRSARPKAHQKPFFAGMTNTQRLRLTRVNPRLLQELEAKELHRRNEFRAARLSRKQRKENVPTADEVHSLEWTDVSRTAECVESGESTARYKCPVPTPRMSKIFVANKDFAGVDPSCFETKASAARDTRREPRTLQRSSSEENLELTLAAVKGDVESDDSVQRGQSTVTGSRSAGRMQAAARLKLNIDDSDAAGQTPSLYGNTSAGNAPQLEGTDAAALLSLEDLGLRKIVDHYDDDDDDDNNDRTEGSYDDKASQEDGEKSDITVPDVSGKCTDPELLLRKVVNQYSDVSEGDEREREYEYDFEDTTVQSVMTLSPINSSASSILDSTVHRVTVSPKASQEADANMKISSHSGQIGRTGEHVFISYKCIIALGGGGAVFAFYRYML